MGLHTMTDHSISEKIEYKYLSFINKVFLVVHIGFLLLFANLKINFMVYFNLGSILFYTLAFLCCKNSKYICMSTSLPLKFSYICRLRHFAWGLAAIFSYVCSA